ncbi:amidase [Bacillus mesophilus]|uniref:Amidase n=1 Tax=Bacillus mesophilus TaxID=1808955 RepID=A0A6M0Q4P8_9BACI|nr:amidase family protein [Bacillus mesophilus]MBM7659910.1 amidase [Bacillus mesophilus]NEY70769.1 amidase [Bacillus mesophilus]
MSFHYKDYDGLGLAQLIKDKQVTPEEVVQAAILEIEKHNSKLNAVINKFYEQGMPPISQTGVFAGVPILLKDHIQQEVSGETVTSGSRALQNYRSAKDSTFVQRIKSTGSTILGQTNIPEFALMGITEPKFHGPTRNPWNINHTPGGSSGGSAAAVSVGMVPIAGANDGGGSIRIPAAYCGLFGLKPTRGRTPVGPTMGRNWQGASVDHVLTRTVRDSAAMLDELSFVERGAAYHAPPYSGSYLKAATQPLGKTLTIAFSTQSPIGTEVHPECKEAVLQTMKLLEKMGHQIVEKEAPVDGAKIAKSYMNMYFGEVAANLRALENVNGRSLTFNDVEPTTWLLGLLGRATTAEEFVLSLQEWDKASFQMDEFHLNYDLYVTPSTAFPPSRIGELEPAGFEKFMIDLVGKLGWGGVLKKAGMIDQIVENSLKRTPFTQLANLTGQPAMSVPLHMTKDGLPLGVQFIAPKGDEDLLIQLAGELEQSELWLSARPTQTS